MAGPAQIAGTIRRMQPFSAIALIYLRSIKSATNGVMPHLITCAPMVATSGRRCTQLGPTEATSRSDHDARKLGKPSRKARQLSSKKGWPAEILDTDEAPLPADRPGAEPPQNHRHVIPRHVFTPLHGRFSLAACSRSAPRQRRCVQMYCPGNRRANVSTLFMYACVKSTKSWRRFPVVPRGRGGRI